MLVDNRPVRGNENLEIRAHLLEISRFDRFIFKIYIVYGVYKENSLSLSLTHLFAQRSLRGSSNNCVCRVNIFISVARTSAFDQNATKCMRHALAMHSSYSGRIEENRYTIPANDDVVNWRKRFMYPRVAFKAEL